MLTPDYVVGLVDGEGSFTVRMFRDLKWNRFRVEARFMLKLQEDDVAALYELQKFFGCGRVYVQNDKRPNHKRCYRYEVGINGELISIIAPFFLANPPKFVSKRKDFDLFVQALRIIESGEHKTDEGKEKVRMISMQMH